MLDNLSRLILSDQGQRLAAQKGQTDDIVGAMQAQEKADENDLSDDDSWQRYCQFLQLLLYEAHAH